MPLSRFVMSFGLKMASADPRAQEVITCDLCTNPVELFCKPCHVRLCQGCVVKHMVSQKSKDHNVVLFQARESEPLHPECQMHDDMRCELHCKTCDVPICSMCVIGSHAKHTFMDLREQIIAKMRTSIEADNIELEKIIIPTYEKKESESIDEISIRKQKFSDIQSDIDDHGTNWHKEIDTIIKKQKAEAKVMEKKDLDRLNKHQSELRDMLSLARDVLKRNKDLLKSNNPSQIRNYKSRNDELKYFPSTTYWHYPAFIPIKLQGEHLYRQFGELKAAIESEIEGFKIKNLNTPEVLITTQTPKDRLWGLAYVHADKMWISGQEDTMDLIDLQGTVLETVKNLSGKNPQGLTMSKEGHLAYGDYNNRNINTVRNGKTSTIVKLSSPWIPGDLCFTLSGDLLVTMYNYEFTETKLIRYDVDYKPKLEIQYDDEGKHLFKEGGKLCRLTENKNRDICVSDGNADCVVTFNQEGKLRWRYTSSKPSSFSPRGIATDTQSQVLIADFRNHCIHITDKDGQFICYIDNCNLRFPFVLDIDNEDHLLVGESIKDEKNKVKTIKYLK